MILRLELYTPEELAKIVVRSAGILGIDIDYEVLGTNGNMLMVTASGTAVKLA